MRHWTLLERKISREQHIYHICLSFQYSTFSVGVSRSAFVFAECPDCISWAISKAASAAKKHKGIIFQILFKNERFKLQGPRKAWWIFVAFCICKKFFPSQVSNSVIELVTQIQNVSILILTLYRYICMYVWIQYFCIH